MDTVLVKSDMRWRIFDEEKPKSATGSSIVFSGDVTDCIPATDAFPRRVWRRGVYPADLVTVVRWPPASERAWWQLVVRLVGHERDNAPSVAVAEIDAVSPPDERGCWHVDDQFHNDSTLNVLHTQYSCVSVGFLSERKTVESILAERYYVMFGHWHRNSVCRLWRWCNLLTAVNFSHHIVA